MASYFITEERIYNMLNSDSIVLEKCNFVHEKSLKSARISFLQEVWEPCDWCFGSSTVPAKDQCERSLALNIDLPRDFDETSYAIANRLPAFVILVALGKVRDMARI